MLNGRKLHTVFIDEYGADQQRIQKHIFGEWLSPVAVWDEPKAEQPVEVKTMKLNEVKLKPKYKIGNIVEYKDGHGLYYSKLVKSYAEATWSESEATTLIRYTTNGGSSLREENITRVVSES